MLECVQQLKGHGAGGQEVPVYALSNLVFSQRFPNVSLLMNPLGHLLKCRFLGLWVLASQSCGH